MKNIFFLIILAGAAYGIYQAYLSSQTETKEARSIKSLPPSVQHAVAGMDPTTQSAFFNEYEAKKKRSSIGYIAWATCGWHYLYLKKVGLQFAFWFTAGGFGVWWFFDLFRMPSIVRSANEQIARDALQTLSHGMAFRAPTNPLTGPIG
jgi:hypothetical protein